MTYNNTTNPLPPELAGHSPAMVNTLVSLGYGEKWIKILLDIADAENNHPDWSEATNEQIDDHFLALAIRTATGPLRGSPVEELA